MKNKYFSLLSAILFLILTFSLSAQGSKVDYEQLAKTGSTKEIKNALKKDKLLKNQVFGDNRETFYMLVLKNSRELEIVKYCIAAESELEAKAKDGRTPIMFAAEFASDPKVVTTVAKAGTVFGIGVSDRLNQTDSAGLNSYDYARKNPDAEILKALTSLAKEEKKQKTSIVTASYSAQDTEQEEEPSESTESFAENQVSQDSSEKSNETSANALKKEDTAAVPRILIKKGDTEMEIITEYERNMASREKVQPEPETPAQTYEIPAENPPVEVPPVENKTVQPEVKAVPEKETVQPEKVQVTPQPEIEYKFYTQSYLYDYAIQQETEPEEKELPLVISNPNKADKNGVTLLMKAAKAGNDWDVKNLIASGADVQLRDKDGWSALMYAVRYQNNLNIVNTLIENGAHVRVRNKYNATPLLLAADYSLNPEIIRVLLKNRSVTEDEVFSAFILALTSSQGESHVQEAKIKLFIEMGIPLNRIWKGKTPLMYAAQYCNSTDVIQLLLDNDAKPGIQDLEGKTAFDYAKKNNQLEHNDTYWSLNSSRK